MRASSKALQELDQHELPSGLPSWMQGQNCSQKEAVVSPVQDSEGAERLPEDHLPDWASRLSKKCQQRPKDSSSCPGLPWTDLKGPLKQPCLGLPQGPHTERSKRHNSGGNVFFKHIRIQKLFTLAVGTLSMSNTSKSGDPPKPALARASSRPLLGPQHPVRAHAQLWV